MAIKYQFAVGMKYSRSENMIVPTRLQYKLNKISFPRIVLCQKELAYIPNLLPSFILFFNFIINLQSTEQKIFATSLLKHYDFAVLATLRKAMNDTIGNTYNMYCTKFSS